MPRKTSTKIVAATTSQDLLTAGASETHQFVSLNITMPAAVTTAFRCTISYYDGVNDVSVASVTIPVYDPLTSGTLYTTTVQIPYLFIEPNDVLRVKNSAADSTHFALSTLF